MEFNSISELYKRIRPALVTKTNELKKRSINYIKEEDIWNYLKEKKWLKTADLSLAEMVNDILNLDNYEIENYVKNKMNSIERIVNLEE